MRLGIALAALAALAWPRVAAAQLKTCVQVEAPGAEHDSLKRAVETELDRHPSHRAAREDCQGYLTVELLDLGAQEGKWLTGRINSQVPQREHVGPDGLVPAVERLLRVVLHNDPLVLSGPRSQNWLDRQKHALEVRSAMHWGAELFELGARLDGGLATLAGVALSLRREADALYIGARVGAAFDPGAQPGRLSLRMQFEAQLEAGWYASPAATTSFFASALLGGVHQRFEGPAPFDGPDAIGSATSMGVTVGGRAGVEALRASDMRLLAYLQLQVPAFVSRDSDHGVVDQWVPCAAVGAGVLF
jgi:hypothetical protein